jgi:hypothetical protein
MSTEPQRQADSGAEEDLKWPVGFIVMVALAALYLILRLVQMAGWAIDWLF